MNYWVTIFINQSWSRLGTELVRTWYGVGGLLKYWNIELLKYWNKRWELQFFVSIREVFWLPFFQWTPICWMSFYTNPKLGTLIYLFDNLACVFWWFWPPPNTLLMKYGEGCDDVWRGYWWKCPERERLSDGETKWLSEKARAEGEERRA